MTRLPRDISATQLISRLARLGYKVLRQRGSHIRLETLENGYHRTGMPNHSPLRVGMLHEILNDVASHFDLSVDELLDRLDLR